MFCNLIPYFLVLLLYLCFAGISIIIAYLWYLYFDIKTLFRVENHKLFFSIISILVALDLVIVYVLIEYSLK